MRRRETRESLRNLCFSPFDRKEVRLRSGRSQELQSIAEWVVGVEAFESRERLIVHDFDPGALKASAERCQVIGEQGGVSLPRR